MIIDFIMTRIGNAAVTEAVPHHNVGSWLHGIHLAEYNPHTPAWGGVKVSHMHSIISWAVLVYQHFYYSGPYGGCPQ